MEELNLLPVSQIPASSRQAFGLETGLVVFLENDMFWNNQFQHFNRGKKLIELIKDFVCPNTYLRVAESFFFSPHNFEERSSKIKDGLNQRLCFLFLNNHPLFFVFSFSWKPDTASAEQKQLLFGF